MNRGLKGVIEFIGLDYKKEMIKLLIINLAVVILAIASYILLKNTYIIIGGIGILGLSNYFILSGYFSKKRMLIKSHSEEFVYIVS